MKKYTRYMSDTLKERKVALGQFDTPVELAHCLVQFFKPEFNCYVDLGAGLGNFSDPIRNQLGVHYELDERRFEHLKSICRHSIQADVLKNPITPIDAGAVLYLSNPPFTSKKLNYHTEALTPKILVGPHIDVAFLDIALKLKKPCDSFLFIMSASFFESQMFAQQRFELIRTFNHVHIVSLPPRIFKGAEVQSYCMYLTNNMQFDSNVHISFMANNLKITQTILLAKLNAFEDLTFKYQLEKKFFSRYKNCNHPTLGSIGCEIIRGSKSSKEFNNSGLSALSTGSLRNKKLVIQDNPEIDRKYRTARSGDILVSRVGTRVITRASLIKHGEIHYCDSLFRIRVPIELEMKVWRSINSELGRKWREFHAKGKCAKHLTVQDVLNMPIFEP